MDLGLSSVSSLPALSGMDSFALRAGGASSKEKILSQETQNAFAAQLAQAAKISSQEATPIVRQSMAILPENAAQGLPVQKEESANETEGAGKKTAAPEIARSWRMEGAEEETKVQETELGWDDFLDLINPLQHIPVLGTIYREITGDEIKPSVQIAGNMLFGAATGSLVISTIAGIASAIYEENTGQEPTVQIAQAIWGDDVVSGPSKEAGYAGSTTTNETVQMGVAQTAMPSVQTKMAAHEAKPPESEKRSPALFASAAGAPKPAEGTPSDRKDNVRYMRIGDKLFVHPAQKGIALNDAADGEKETKKASASIAEKNVDGPTLAAMMHGQAEAKAAGQSLPPALVQDMMLMALDKYKTAQAFSSEPDETLMQ